MLLTLLCCSSRTLERSGVWGRIAPAITLVKIFEENLSDSVVSMVFGYTGIRETVAYCPVLLPVRLAQSDS